MEWSSNPAPEPHVPTYALLSDIHGNLPALEAVLADLEHRAIDQVINLGDLVSGPLWPRETADLLMGRAWIQIAGNHERQLLTQPLADQKPSDRYASGAITEPQRTWLAGLPPQLRLGEGIQLFHATPPDDDTYLLETVQGGRVHAAGPGEILARLGGVRAPLMLCGHSHLPRIVQAGGDLVVNPGSVGLQAYDATRPEAHVVEAGSPLARYAVLRLSGQGPRVDLVAVPYDHERAALRAQANGRPEWARALRTGFMGA